MADYQRQDAGGDGVERSKVAHFGFGGAGRLSSNDAAHLAHHIVRCPTLGFVDYDDSVQ